MPHRRDVLEELVYEHVRVRADLAQLLEFEEDLSKSIERITVELGGTIAATEDLKQRFAAQAWTRLEQEWQREVESSECPLCMAEPAVASNSLAS